MPVLSELVPVEFYTPLDAYYYETDNRPLRNLDENIKKIAEASDSSSGGANRAALSAASAAYSILGFGKLVSGDPIRQAQGMYSGKYSLSGLSIRMEHGFLVRPVDRGGLIPYIEPVVAVHDALTSLVVQPGRGGTLQVTYRDSTSSDRVASGASPVQVAVITFKQGTGPGIYPLPDAGNIVLAQINVPVGATALLDSHITLVNMKTIEQTANVLERASIGYVQHGVTLSTGQSTIALTGTVINTGKMSAVEVFVDGVTQFNWTYNSVTKTVSLQSPVTSAASVLIRQITISLV